MQETRASDRYAVNPDVRCHVDLGQGGSFLFAALSDVSLGGVGLRIVEPLEVGTYIGLGLSNVSGLFAWTRPARVRFCVPMRSGDYFIGCELARPLTGTELDVLRGELLSAAS
jgi:hypothetical protein